MSFLQRDKKNNSGSSLFLISPIVITKHEEPHTIARPVAAQTETNIVFGLFLHSVPSMV